MLFRDYNPGNFFDEMVSAPNSVRRHYTQLADRFSALTPEEFRQKRDSVDLSFLRQGITFNVYGDTEGTEDRDEPSDPRQVGQRHLATEEGGTASAKLRRS